jgi:hypothetical protein
MAFGLPINNWVQKEESGSQISQDALELLGKKEREKIKSSAEFTAYLDDFCRKRQGDDETPHIIINTYNRVGDGRDEGRVHDGRYVLDIWVGAPDIPLDEKGTDRFLKETETRLDAEMPYIAEKKPLMIFYAGEWEKFYKTAAMIDRLDATFGAYKITPENRPEIFLLTCGCRENKKIKAIIPLLRSGRLRGLIRGNEKHEGCGCGGMRDLQNIADYLENKYAPEKKDRDLPAHAVRKPMLKGGGYAAEQRNPHQQTHTLN